MKARMKDSTDYQTAFWGRDVKSMRRWMCKTLRKRLVSIESGTVHSDVEMVDEDPEASSVGKGSQATNPIVLPE